MPNSHDKEVLVQAWAYNFAGYSVLVDHLEAWRGFWERPYKINNHIPDIIAQKINSRIIIEVEPFNKLDDPHTRSQVEAFEKAANECPNTEFRLVVIYSSQSGRLPEMFQLDKT